MTDFIEATAGADIYSGLYTSTWYSYRDMKFINRADVNTSSR